MIEWFRLDVDFSENKKVCSVPVVARWFHLAALCYCARNLTDGHVSERQTKVIAAICDTTPKRWVSELVKADLWAVDEAGGYRINDYLDYQPSRAEMKDLEEKRREAGRAGGIASAEAKREAKREASAEANGQAQNKTKQDHAPPPSLALAKPSTSPSDDEDDSHESGGGRVEELYRACGNTSEGSERLRRAIRARNPSYETIARAIDAAKAPCDSPLAVALAIIAPNSRKGAA